MSFYKDKIVLVTGAGGSIGSELSRQLAEQGLNKLILLDSSELALYNIERKLRAPNVETVLGDITESADVHTLFRRYPIDVVFHAAAYKHVTLCEKNPVPAGRVNIYGTRVLVGAATQYKVPTFILISTDKAVRPTSVMGWTKQQAEDIVREAGYTTVRLGNVRGSSGSVIPLWQEQIAAGEPVTITHPKATRYFISEYNAVRGILQAAKIAAGGDVYVPDMGGPRLIVDIAKQLGAREFKYIGLRPGEKLHEELFAGEPGYTSEPGIWEDAA